MRELRLVRRTGLRRTHEAQLVVTAIACLASNSGHAQEFEGGKLDTAIRVGSGWLGIGVIYGETVVRLKNTSHRARRTSISTSSE